MCLYTLIDEFRADRDITVWKAVRVDKAMNKWLGIYGYDSKRYGFDEVVANRSPKDVFGRRTVSHTEPVWKRVGGGFFHSCMERKDAERYKSDIDFVDSAFLAKSPDIMREYRPIGDGYFTVVLECTIPKGTVCYCSRGGSFASRKIIVHSGRLLEPEAERPTGQRKGRFVGGYAKTPVKELEGAR